MKRAVLLHNKLKSGKKIKNKSINNNIGYFKCKMFYYHFVVRKIKLFQF